MAFMFSKCSKIISILMLLMLLCMLLIPVLADEETLGTDDDLTGYVVPEEGSSGESDMEEVGANPWALIVPTFIDDGLDKILIFSIRADEVTYLLTSNMGGKMFMGHELPDIASTIVCEAYLNHSWNYISGDWAGMPQNLNEAISYGVCYYTYDYAVDDYIYKAVGRGYVTTEELGGYSRAEIEIAGNFEQNEAYYSFVKNRFYGGYVYGTLDIYWKP